MVAFVFVCMCASMRVRICVHACMRAHESVSYGCLILHTHTRPLHNHHHPPPSTTTHLPFIVKTVDAVDGRALVVPAEDEEVLGVFDFVGQKQANRLHALVWEGRRI